MEVIKTFIFGSGAFVGATIAVKCNIIFSEWLKQWN